TVMRDEAVAVVVRAHVGAVVGPGHTVVTGDGGAALAAGELPGDSRPARAAVGAAINVGAGGVAHADINGLGRIARGATAWINRDPGKAHNIALVYIAGHLGVLTDIRETHLGPGAAEVGAPPQTSTAAGAQPQVAVAVGVDHQARAH